MFFHCDILCFLLYPFLCKVSIHPCSLFPKIFLVIVLLWGLMQGKLESMKRSLQAVLGLRHGLLSLTPPIWQCAGGMKMCRLQVFGSVRGRRELVSELVLARERTGFASTWVNPLPQLVRALTAALSCSGLDFLICSIFSVRKRA